MKSFIKSIILLFLISQLNAVPSPRQKIPEISGVVVNGVWRKGFQIHRVHLTEMIEDQVEPSTEELPDHWILILENVKGLTEKQLQEINESFLMRGPSEQLSESAKKQGRLLLWISAGKDIKLKIGSKIKIVDLEYQSDERGGSLSYKNIIIE